MIADKFPGLFIQPTVEFTVYPVALYIELIQCLGYGQFVLEQVFTYKCIEADDNLIPVLAGLRQRFLVRFSYSIFSPANI